MGKRIVYAWALDAPSKKLPDGVGLRVGGDTDIQYLVLQLHYKQKFTSNVCYWLQLTLAILAIMIGLLQHELKFLWVIINVFC